LHQQNGSVVGTCVKIEPVGRMLPRIHRYNIYELWERNCNAFIWKEAEITKNYMEDTHEVVLYSERSSDQYEIFWVKFPEEIFH
jgi:hypothetical protein